ncbi:MAG: response regulator [Hyalangium sp.]|uniref:response regulator n=1 Tax=Hyalangium sp. TaxID=2028555 RepID=UPI00389A72CF
MSAQQDKQRILVIDDSEPIHNDFRRILCPARPEKRVDLELLEEALFGEPVSKSPPSDKPVFEVDSAFQGQEGLAKVQEALAQGRPYALAFLDYRMPPGWNGVQTLRHLRKVAPSLQVVLCSAYSDYSWEEVFQEFSAPPALVELRKPFNSQEIRQLAQRLTEPRAAAPGP